MDGEEAVTWHYDLHQIYSDVFRSELVTSKLLPKPSPSDMTA